MDKTQPKISFGIIVFNGEPFVKYCLRALYPFAHEIIVVEGAVELLRSISTGDGHSTDTTRESVLDFIEHEDTSKKVKFITKDGFWKNKDEMSQAYANASTGDYLWQIDVDEFYLEKDMVKIIELLRENPTIDGISFKMKAFWGGIDYLEESAIFGDVYRLFKFGPGYTYATHEPVLVLDNKGQDVKKKNWVDGYTMQMKYKIFMYHYSLIFPDLIRGKVKFYEKLWGKKFIKWSEESFFKLSKPYHVNINYWKISWLRRYTGEHNAQITQLFNDIKNKKIDVELRSNEDVDVLLNSPIYRVTTWVLHFYFEIISMSKRFVKKLIYRKK